MQSDPSRPRPPRLRHQGGKQVQVSSETSEMLRQRDDAAAGGEGRTLHRGGSNGVSCALG